MRAALGIVILLALAPAARAEEPTTADGWLEAGLAHYEAGAWKEAIAAFERGHALDPRPQFLFAIGQAERRRGDCRRAITYYRRFLTTSPPEAQAEAARRQEAACEEALASAPAPAPVVLPPRVETKVVRVVEVERERPWWKDPVTLGTTGGAAALLATGGALLLSASGAADAAGRAETYDEHAALRDRAGARQTAGLVTLGLGAALGGYAVFRIVRGGETYTEERVVEVTPGPGLGVALGGRF